VRHLAGRLRAAAEILTQPTSSSPADR